MYHTPGVGLVALWEIHFEKRLTERVSSTPFPIPLAVFEDPSRK